MTRENFKKQKPGPQLVDGELLNQYARAVGSTAQGRGGRNAHSINGTINTNPPDTLPLIGIAVVRGSPQNDANGSNPRFTDQNLCQQDDDGNYLAPCYELIDGTVIGLYVAAFRYWDIDENGWREYEDEITLDVAGYFEGYDATGNQGWQTLASYSAGGPGFGAIPKLYPGETVAAIYDPVRGAAIPLFSSTPQDEAFIEYVHRRGIEGDIRVLEDDNAVANIRGYDAASAGVVATLIHKSNDDSTEASSFTAELDSIWWRLQQDSCCDPTPCPSCPEEDSSSSSDQTIVQSSFSSGSTSTSSSSGVGADCAPLVLETKTGFATAVVGHGDTIRIQVTRNSDPTGNCYVEEATLRIGAIGRYNATAQIPIYPLEALNHNATIRTIAGWRRRTVGSGRHTDLPVYCPQGPNFLCPEGDYSGGQGDKIYIALRDQNEKFQIRIDYKVTIRFEPDEDGLSSTSNGGLSELSTVSTVSDGQSLSTSSTSISDISTSSSSSSLSTSSSSSISISDGLSLPIESQSSI